METSDEEVPVTYSTTDFYTAAVLISQKFEVQSVSLGGPGNRVKRFHFKESPAIRSTVMSYMNRILVGNLREFRDAIETVKDLVHSD